MMAGACWDELVSSAGLDDDDEHDEATHLLGVQKRKEERVGMKGFETVRAVLYNNSKLQSGL